MKARASLDTSPHSRAFGFTIVELLIVVVVIAVLASVVVITYAGLQSRARDMGRIQKLTAIAKALEMYRTVNGRYPAITDGSGMESTCGSQTENWGHCDRTKALSDALAPYMALDPVSLSSVTTGTSYYYYYNSATNDGYAHYGMMVVLEGSGGQNDGGYYANAYEVGDSPSYCTKAYTGASASWRWSSSNTRCQGGN